LGTALFPGAGEKASAGMCERVSGTPGAWTCSGAADPTMDTTQSPSATHGERFVVTTEPGFGMNVATGRALSLVTVPGGSLDATIGGTVSSRGTDAIGVQILDGTGQLTTPAALNAAQDGIDLITTAAADSITVNATGAITAGNRGIYIGHQGLGAVVINSGGNINAVDNGIDVETTGISQSSVTINATGDIRSGSLGIKAEHLGRGELSIFLAPNANIMTTGAWGIDAAANTIGHTGNPPGGMNIMAMGNINASGSAQSGGILARHDTRGDLNITIGGDINTTGTSIGRGVDARTGVNSSALNIDVTGNITSASLGGVALDHKGTGDITVNVAPGASVNAPAAMRTGIFAGISRSNGNLGDIVVDIAGTVRGGEHAVRTGASNSALVRLRPGANIIGAITAAGDNTTFELAAATAPFANTPSFNLGQLSGFDTVRKTGPNTWAIDGSVTVDESFSLDDGALFLDEDASVTISGNYAGNGGRLVMSANFATGGFSILNITNEVTGTTPIDLIIHGNPNAAARTHNVISLFGADAANAANHFTGSADSGFYAFRLNCDSAAGACAFIRDGFGDVGKVIESYPATLAQLSSLPSMQQRLEGRVWQDEKGVGVWGRVEGSVASFEPGVSTAKSEYDIQDTRIRFGADYPFEEVKGLTLGGNVWFGLANTDIAPGDGEIETTGYSVAATATMEQGNFYADGQFQYALFSSDLTSSQLSVSGSDATAFSVSGEAGYRYPLSGVNVTPQAQVIWTTADFDDFRNTLGTETASLEDGAALTGRVGVFVDKELKALGSESEYGDSEAGKGNVYAGLNLLVPLDGETAVRVRRGSSTHTDNLTSELESIAGDLSVGGSYTWGKERGVFGEAAVSLGSEIMEYRANVGLRFGF
ncbi:MAG: autotransporter outer membrane beta-barrel domain-containing protein, partial [Candidatus Dadabacteria bacterium]|nr:autotransporter outer membrane beta-barrel domain-containing protein [Candidatus Dadabacteria bacterium]